MYTKESTLKLINELKFYEFDEEFDEEFIDELLKKLKGDLKNE